MTLTTTQIREKLEQDYNKILTRQAIHLIIKAELIVGKDYNYLNGRLILVNTQGYNKILKKLKLKSDLK